MATYINAHGRMQAPRSWSKAELDEAWHERALYFLAEEGIPAVDAIELFGGSAIATACNLDPSLFEVVGNCWYLTYNGFYLTGAICNLELCGREYGADDLRAELARGGFALPEKPTKEAPARKQRGQGTKTRRADIKPMWERE